MPSGVHGNGRRTLNQGRTWLALASLVRSCARDDGTRLIFVLLNLPVYFFKLCPGRSYPACELEIPKLELN